MIMNALLGHAIGDAIGVPFEMWPREYVRNSKVELKKKSIYSDDTAMVLATMSSIINNGGNINYEDIMTEFCLWLKDGKYASKWQTYGVGTTTYNALRNYFLGMDALNCGINDTRANGNGALMRMLPIVFYLKNKNASEQEIINITENITKLTHSNEINIMGTYIYVKYFLYLLEGYTKEESYEKIKKLDYSRFSNKTRSKYIPILMNDLKTMDDSKLTARGSVFDTLEAVLWVILHTNNFEDAILIAVNLGGDADTITAITGGIAGTLYKNEIPRKWYKRIIGIKDIIRTGKEFDKVVR